MNASPESVAQLQEQLEAVTEQLGSVPANHTETAEPHIERCKKCLGAVPSTDTPVYIHIIGTDKSFKTSYLLDLFANDDLRKVFSLKARNTSENTAVPCLLEPDDQVSRIQADQVSISSGRVLRENLDQKQFTRLYDLASGATPDDYLIRIKIPKSQTPMDIPVIEYPGIKEGADARERQKKLHQAFQNNMMSCLVRFPGILVACFQHKVSIPVGHPLDAVLQKYGHVLKTNYSHHKLPLVVSLQGETAIAGYCGNTNVMEDLASDFQSYQNFDSVVQLVNPCNLEYPVHFSDPGPHVDTWIREISRYTDLTEIKEHISLDGGITWSRAMLREICTTSYIREALHNLFFKPWLVDAQKTLTLAQDCFYSISSYDEVNALKEQMRKAVINETYQSLNDIFETELGFTDDGMVTDHEHFWISVFSQYLGQFFEEKPRVAAIAQGMWDCLQNRLDPLGKGFLGARTKDIPFIIMNMAQVYVPNCLMRGDYILMEETADKRGQNV